MAKEKATGSRNKKLSEIVAAQLMEQIREMGWPVGESLGTESELMARFQVSRATIAEAVRQVERYGAAVMRRGAGGGLVVSSSARSALSRTISTYLELANVSLSEQYEAAEFIEMEAVKCAADRLTEDRVDALRKAMSELYGCDDNVTLHRLAMHLRLEIAEAGDNKAIVLFMRSLARVLTHYVRPDLRTRYRDREFENGVVADLSGIIEAIIAGNSVQAALLVKEDVARREHRARELAIAQPLLEGGPLRREASNKLAEKVAYAIRDDIAKTGWQEGQKLGDEAELPERYDVSHWVLRQAIRILEPSGIVTVRRGQGGGIYIGKPNPEHTIEATVSYLNSYIAGTGRSLVDYQLLRRSIFQVIAQHAASRGTLDERERLCQLAEEVSQTNGEPNVVREFWSSVLTMGRNKILGLFGIITNEFINANVDSGCPADKQALIHQAAASIQEGDGPLARRKAGLFFQVV